MRLRENTGMISPMTPNARHDHDVDGRVRVEPEEVLEQHRVAAERRVEDADVQSALDDQQEQRDAEDRRREHLDERGRVERPEEQRQPEPGHARRRAACGS